MDAGEPPEPSAAIVARAEPKSALRAMPRSYYSMQAGFGLGAGTYGLAGSYFVFGDAWPLPFLGVGLEWNRAGSTMVRLFEAEANDLHNAIRGRVSFRGIVGARSTLSAVASIGRGTFAVFPLRACTSEAEPGCLDHPNGYTGGKETRGANLSFGGQLGMHGRYGPNGRVTFGLVLRADVVVPAFAVTFGPTLGFEI